MVYRIIGRLKSERAKELILDHIPGEVEDLCRLSAINCCVHKIQPELVNGSCVIPIEARQEISTS